MRSLIDDYSGLNISHYRILEKLGGAGIICVGIRSWGYVVGTVTDPSGVPGAKSFSLTERVKLRFDTQFFNVFNHPNFALPSMVLAGIPGKPATQTGFGAIAYATSPPTGLLGVGLGGGSTPRMIAFRLALEF